MSHPSKHDKPVPQASVNLLNLAALLPYVLLAMQQAQAIKNAKSTEKRKAAIEAFVETVIGAAELGIGQDVLDDALVLAATGELIDALKGFENVIADAKARHHTT